MDANVLNSENNKEREMNYSYTSEGVKAEYEKIKDMPDSLLCEEWEPILAKVKLGQKLDLHENAVFLRIKTDHPDWVKNIIKSEVVRLVKFLLILAAGAVIVVGMFWLK